LIDEEEAYASFFVDPGLAYVNDLRNPRETVIQSIQKYNTFG
jgi:hypothetical protein